MQQIKDWLSGKKNFIIGRAIYRATISSSDELIQLLDKGYSEYSHQQLINAMQAHLEPPAVISNIKKEQKVVLEHLVAGTDQELNPPSIELTPTTVTINPIDPLVIKAIDKEWQIPYKEMQGLIAKLDQFGDANDKNAISTRKELAEKILDLERYVNSIWAKKDQYLKTGTLQSEEKEELQIPTDPLELADLINRVKKGIRNNRIRMQKNPDKPGYAEKYQHYKMLYFKITGKHYQDKV